MSEDALPESDRVDELPHPRETFSLFGQDEAEATFISALNSDRLHHAWLLTGPRGIGKATFAWRAARHLLTTPPPDDGGLFGDAPSKIETLDVDEHHPVVHRMAALSEPGLLLIRRSWDSDRKRLRAQITVDDVRKLSSFFGLSATDGGRRVVIIDTVDDMNPSAANALLKVLEEPPKNAIFFLVSHAPQKLLLTIRSRCRQRRFQPLNKEDLSLALTTAGLSSAIDSTLLVGLAGGSVGEAATLAQLDGPALYSDLVKLCATCPQLDRGTARQMIEKLTARGAEARLELFIRMLDLFLGRMAHFGVGKPPASEVCGQEFDTFARLTPTSVRAKDWATLQQELSDRIRHGLAVNVDAQSLIMDAFLQINGVASRS